MVSQSTFALVLAGGQSSRLFPFNKILSDLTGTGRTLLQQSYDRATRRQAKFPPVSVSDHFYVLTQKDYIPKIRKQLRLPLSHCFADPVRRGTWPALLWAMAHLRRKNPNAVIAVLTADHLIADPVAFRKSVAEAIELADERPVIAMIGVDPSKQAADWTGFGALRAEADGSHQKGFPVRSFEEKPTVERAAQMMKDGGWLWNSGMFFFRIPVAEEALHVYQPSMARIYERLIADISAGRSDEARQTFTEFPEKIPHPFHLSRDVDNTIDYAILAPLVRRPESGLGVWASANALRKWADVGEWTSLARFVKADRQGNFLIGKVRVGKGVRNCILAADSGTSLIVEGVVDRIIAFSNGKALVIPNAEAPNLKSLVAQQPGRLVAVDAGSLNIEFAKNKLRVRPR